MTIITQTAENFDELVWIKPKKEFTYKGTMYDVVRKTIEDNGDITYHCINDTQETTLFVNLDNLVKKNMDSRNGGKDPLKNLLNSLFFSSTKIDFDPELINQNHEKFSAYSFNYTSPELAISGPPPKNLS